jgi:hypothetical protein
MLEFGTSKHKSTSLLAEKRPVAVEPNTSTFIQKDRHVHKNLFSNAFRKQAEKLTFASDHFDCNASSTCSQNSIRCSKSDFIVPRSSLTFVDTKAWDARLYRTSCSVFVDIAFSDRNLRARIHDRRNLGCQLLNNFLSASSWSLSESIPLHSFCTSMQYVRWRAVPIFMIAYRIVGRSRCLEYFLHDGVNVQTPIFRPHPSSHSLS